MLLVALSPKTEAPSQKLIFSTWSIVGAASAGGATARQDALEAGIRDAVERTAIGLVVITPLATHEVAEDIAARLARGRVYQPEGWDIVRQLFQAKETDARVIF